MCKAGAGSSGQHWAPAAFLDVFRWQRAMYCHDAEGIAFAEHERAELGVAYARGVLQHGLEHGLQVAGRTADDLQHLRGRGLLLQRLAQLTRARLHLVEQPHVLDRDYRLVGEGGGELNLLVGEWPDRLALQTDDADRESFSQQRDGQYRAEAGD